MSIPEAFNRFRQIGGGPDKSGREAYEERYAYVEAYEAEVLQRGTDLLREAGVPGILEELRGYIHPKFPDATLDNVDPNGSRYFGQFGVRSGMVEMNLGWNYVEGEGRRGSRYNRISVLAQPLTGALVVEGTGAEYIPATIWRSPKGKEVLEDAIVKAYSNPPRFSPSARI